MRKVEKDNKYIRFYNENDEFVIQALSDEICIYFDSYNGNEFVVNRDDGILFDEVDNLYNSIHETWNRQEKHYLPQIIENGHIEVHSCDKDYNSANSFALYKVNNDEYKYIYNIKDLDNPGVLISMNGLDMERNMYSPYNRLFLQMYINLYKHDYEQKDDMKLKLKK